MVESQLVHMPLTLDGNMLQRAHFPVLEEPQLIHRYFLTSVSISLIWISAFIQTILFSECRRQYF
jgi:hypothetical protein